MNISSSTDSPQIDLANIKRTPIVIALIIGAFVTLLNETLLGNALKILMDELQVNEPTIQWLTTAYMLVVGVLVPITAILQQWWTSRQMFLISMITFLIGTMIAASAPGFEMLLIGRIVQAVGTGLMLPLMMNTILVIFPPEKRGGAMGIMGLVIMFAPAIGPTLSGMIIDTLSWRWLFIIVIPLTVISIIFGIIYMKNVTVITKPKIDILSILLSTLGFGGIVYGFSSSGQHGWSDPMVYWTISVGAIALLLFTIRQLKVKNPILELRAFKFPMFTITVILIFIVMMSMFSTMILLPLFLQTVLLVTAFKSGLIMLPASILNGFMAPITGKLFDKFGPRVIIVPGIALVCVSIWLFSGIDTNTTTAQIITYHIILMIGVSLAMMPTQTHGLNQLTPELYPHGSAIFSTLQQVAGAIGTALFISRMSNEATSYMSASTNPTDPLEALLGLTAGYQAAFKMGLVLAIIALVLSFFVKMTGRERISEHSNEESPSA